MIPMFPNLLAVFPMFTFLGKKEKQEKKTQVTKNEFWNLAKNSAKLQICKNLDKIRKNI